jgi:hypothetical protein
MRDLTKWQCPECATEKGSSSRRTCNKCGYRGDWIQPGEVMTYSNNKKFLGVESISLLFDERRKSENMGMH